MEFKDALRRRREHLGLSPEQLAKLLTRFGSPTTAADVQLWERGRNHPPFDAVEFRGALARALQTSVEKIEKGMRLAERKAPEPEAPAPPPLCVEALRAAELVDSMPDDLRTMALAVLDAMLRTRQQNGVAVLPRDFWDS